MPRLFRAFAAPGALFLAVLVAGCSPAPDGRMIHDPYEPVNRSVHAFNLALDQAVLRDAGAAAAQLPPEVRDPVVNFADNVALPGMVLNNLLQLDVGGAVTNATRFLINSTVGVAGLLDPAAGIGIEEVETDFGATLAVWGFPEGAYVELPFFGPSTERDAAGRVVDLALDPLGEIVWVPEEVGDYGLVARAAEQVIERGVFSETIDSVLYDSADSYAQARLIYLQNRRFELGGADAGPTSDTFVDPFEELE